MVAMREELADTKPDLKIYQCGDFALGNVSAPANIPSVLPTAATLAIVVLHQFSTNK